MIQQYKNFFIVFEFSTVSYLVRNTPKLCLSENAIQLFFVLKCNANVSNYSSQIAEHVSSMYLDLHKFLLNQDNVTYRHDVDSKG